MIAVAGRPLPICPLAVIGGTVERTADSRNYPEQPEKATANGEPILTEKNCAGPSMRNRISSRSCLPNVRQSPAVPDSAAPIGSWEEDNTAGPGLSSLCKRRPGEEQGSKKGLPELNEKASVLNIEKRGYGEENWFFWLFSIEKRTRVRPETSYFS